MRRCRETYSSNSDSTRRPSADWSAGSTSSRNGSGEIVARNVPAGEPAFGIGSHCDSNRNGGRFDGTLGVVTALEVCRLNAELDLGLADGPEAGDETVEQDGVRVYLDRPASELLSDKVLDAQRHGDHVHFAIGEQGAGEGG